MVISSYTQVYLHSHGHLILHFYTLQLYKHPWHEQTHGSSVVYACSCRRPSHASNNRFFIQTKLIWVQTPCKLSHDFKHDFHLFMQTSRDVTSCTPLPPSNIQGLTQPVYIIDTPRLHGRSWPLACVWHSLEAGWWHVLFAVGSHACRCRPARPLRLVLWMHHLCLEWLVRRYHKFMMICCIETRLEFGDHEWSYTCLRMISFLTLLNNPDTRSLKLHAHLIL